MTPEYTNIRVDSSLRRIQRFMSDYLLDTNLIARFVFALLPHKPLYRLALDRTNWKFGTTNININFNKIRYHIRIRENFWVVIPKNGHLVKAS